MALISVEPPAASVVLEIARIPDWKLAPVPLPSEYVGVVVFVPPVPELVPPEVLEEPPNVVPPPHAVSDNARAPMAAIETKFLMFLT